jgi:hypothetical protein
MKIVAHDSVSGVVNQFKQVLSKNPAMDQALAGMELSVGPATDSAFAIDAGAALNSPLMIGDAMVGKFISNKTLDAMIEKNPESVGVMPTYNKATNKFDMVAVDKKRGLIGDAAPNLLTSQLLSPASFGWIQSYFKKPVVESIAREMVSIQSGNNPWATVINMGMLDFSGFATLSNAGAANNRMSQDVEVQSGAMSSAVINMDVTWRLTVDEVERSKSENSAPWIGQAIAYKKKYAQYALDMLTNSLIYYGNTATSTVGLISLNGATAWSGVGSSMSTIAAGASTTKGSDAYALLAKVISDFLTSNQNMVDTVKIAMSPLAMNILGYLPYSQAYNPKSVLAIIKENFMSGENTTGQIANIEFHADPLLGPSTIYNAQTYDYLVITAPKVKSGLSETQDTLIYAEPLPDFMYPVIPGQYATPYKQLRRIGGLFAPYTPAVKVYSGFGV